MATIDDTLNRLGDFSQTTELAGKDFLATWDFSDDEIMQTLLVAEILRDFHEGNVSTQLLNPGKAVSIFRDQSTRTRNSFFEAAALLGMHVMAFDEETSQVGHGETERETAVMLGFNTDIFGIRDDIYLGRGHSSMETWGRAFNEAVRSGSLPHRPGIINLQSDVDHPTQAMADLGHLVRHFGSPAELRGKKIVMSWAYSPSYGKPLSVPQGIIGLLTRYGADVVLAHPEGYGLIPEVVQRAGTQARNAGGQFMVVHDMAEAFKGADVVYPKSWASYEAMQRRLEILGIRDKDARKARYKELEADALAQNAKYKGWECTEKMMKLTRKNEGAQGTEALYMHCLPADITGVSCEEGEVARTVFERYRDQTDREASWKPNMIGAMILNYIYGRKVVDALRHVHGKNAPRIWTPGR